ncbi:MAG: serine/threonine protein kinase [Deltaproteobacteria bacterium]|nr:serine/threonine protein kinase [Deltaproteobacteria bacterium]
MLSGDVLHRFHVTGPLARGGMGELWLADDEQHRRVVLKTVRDDLVNDDEVRRCFRREIAVVSRVRHAHIVHHVAHGVESGVDVLALEHIEGASLATLRHRTPLPLAAALCVADDVARALAHVHGIADAHGTPLGLVHGDVSPQNIIVDARGHALLIDFGGVTWRGADVTPGTLIGKPGYVSPEQLEGRELDGRSDLYALGVVLWEMITGQTLFASDDLRRDRPVPPPSRYARVPDLIDATVMRMVASEREARFPSAAEAAELIESAALLHGIDGGRQWLGARAAASEGEVDLTRTPVITTSSARTLR